MTQPKLTREDLLAQMEAVFLFKWGGHPIGVIEKIRTEESCAKIFAALGQASLADRSKAVGDPQ